MQRVVSLDGDVQEYLKLVELMKDTSLANDYPSLIDDLSSDFSRSKFALACYSDSLVGGLVYDDFGNTVLIDAIVSKEKGVGRLLMYGLENLCDKAKIFTLAT